MTREWNATAYDELPLPHVEWGRRTVDRLQPVGTERVLDAGCGTGRDADHLLTQYPKVDLVGIDGSQQMVQQATDRLGSRATFVVGDLTEPLDVVSLGRTPGLFDAVMSVACFHWITDHAALFAHLAAVLRPGGRLVSDSGGEGNISVVEKAIAQVEGTPYVPMGFASPDETRRNLEQAGFDVRSVALRPSPVRLTDPALLERYLATVCLGSYLERMTPDDGAAFVTAVREAMSEPVLDYVRLEIDAVRR